jgi:DNA-binding MarR family transcriptional regulator
MQGLAELALCEARGGRAALDPAPLPPSDALHAKLWGTPCWFSYRMNYLAQRFNEPVYGRIAAVHELLRAEFVVLYSLYLQDRQTLSDIVSSSAFPKNTLSRAVQNLSKRGLLRRTGDKADQRRAPLHLTETGRDVVATEMAPMLQRERLMLEVLSPAERLTLSDILSKLVVASRNWPAAIAVDDGKFTENVEIFASEPT